VILVIDTLPGDHRLVEPVQPVIVDNDILNASLPVNGNGDMIWFCITVHFKKVYIVVLCNLKEGANSIVNLFKGMLVFLDTCAQRITLYSVCIRQS